MTAERLGYSPDWVSGLNLEPGYSITMVRGIGPRDALHRMGISDDVLRTACWPELAAQADELRPEHVAMAAFVLGEHTVIIERNGYRGRLADWNRPLSRGTEIVNVYLDPSNGNQELSIIKDGELLAVLDGDAPDDIDVADDELAARLSRLVSAALRPLDDDYPDSEDLDDYWVDLVQVACGYLGLQPRTEDFSGLVLGGTARV